jgi:YD repeat-containing protein
LGFVAVLTVGAVSPAQAAGFLLGGERVSDAFRLVGPDASAPCRTAFCGAGGADDARERLVQETALGGTAGLPSTVTTGFTRDAIGNVTGEQASAQAVIARGFSGRQLASVSQGASTRRCLYDLQVNLDCVVYGAWAAASCPAVVAGQTPNAAVFAGTIDEVALYPTGLSAAAVQSHYTAPAGSVQAYAHIAYDANGQRTVVSLPSNRSDPASLQTAEKTTVSYWDPGWVLASTDPATPRARFDYTPEGWQAARTPDLAASPGTLDLGRTMYWDYLPDGLLQALRDLGGQRASYAYDANGNKTVSNEANGRRLARATTAPANSRTRRSRPRSPGSCPGSAMDSARPTAAPTRANSHAPPYYL